MKVIIAGSRDFDVQKETHRLYVRAQISIFQEFIGPIKEIVSGGARGIDIIGEYWAQYYNIPLKIFPANWDKYGKGAGYKRNSEMAEYADALIAIRLNGSKGTGHMIDLAKSKFLKTLVLEINNV